MAITKHDMFDFLIDIVPREEIQMKSKAGKVHVRLVYRARPILSLAKSWGRDVGKSENTNDIC